MPELRLWPRGGLWRHPDFLKLWSGQTISQFGTQISLLAIPLAAVLVLDASAFQVAQLSTVEYLPFLLFTLPAGVWVDRLPRRPILVVADLGRCAALASIPISYAFDALTIWQLYAVGFVAGTLTVFFDVAYQAYLPSLVGREHLLQGNSLLEMSVSVASVSGPGVSGLIVGALTAPVAILLDAVSFLLSGVAIALIRVREPPREPVGRPSVRSELWDGLRYIVGHRYWRPIAVTVGSSNFAGMIMFSIFVVYAVRSLDMSPATIGLVITLGSVGGVIGAALAGRISRRFGVGPTIVGSAFFFGPPLVLVPLAPQSAPIPYLVAAFLVATAGGTVFNITGRSLMQTLTPERLLGRMTASRRFLVWGTIPLGSLVGGVLASWIGMSATLWVGAIATCFTFLPVAFSPIRRIGEMPTEQEADHTRTVVPAVVVDA